MSAEVKNYMPQLDGLRALAVLAVVWEHWFPWDFAVLGAGLGELGVLLFFVLSGFLITGILLDGRRDGADQKGHVIKQFYMRRFLRIFPLYYGTLFVIALLGIPPFRETFWWHFTYLQNYYQFGNGRNMWGAHLWSLAIEEQFYLVWPFVVLFFTERGIVIATLISILAAPLIRYFCWTHPVGGDPNLLLPGSADTLGLGAGLAIMSRNLRQEQLSKVLKIGIGCTIFSLLVIGLTDAKWIQAFRPTAFGCLFVWVVWHASVGIKGFAGAFLQSRPSVYVGRISYGVYVIHGFPQAVLIWLLYSAPIPGYRIITKLGLPANILDSDLFKLLWNFAFTGTLAVLSWRFFEQPINRLKKHFPYLKPTSPANI